jgi:hypothetical protein
MALAIANLEARRILEDDGRFATARDLRVGPDPLHPTRLIVSMDLILAGGEALQVGNLAEARVDEVNLGLLFDPDTISAQAFEDDDPLLEVADLEGDDLDDDAAADVFTD